MSTRQDQLRTIAKGYVEALGKGDFEAIPYHDQITLRAPILPGGSAAPITGRKTLEETWWAPLPQLVESTSFIDSYVNRDENAVTAEFLCHIRQPACTLRIIDRFKIDADGQIVEQENFFDPRALTG